MKILKQILFLLFSATYISSFGQSQINNETSFLFYLKIYYKEISDVTVAEYASKYDKSNYEVIKNDEFKKVKYINQTKEKIKNKINALNFNKEYYFTVKSEFGKYDFSDNSFPITSLFKGYQLTSNYAGGPLNFGWMINMDYFDYKIKLPADKAENIVNSRKDISGYVDRTVETKFIFSFVNQHFHNYEINDEYFGTWLVIYLTRIEFYSNGNLLSAIQPFVNFEDPASGYKVLNGKETIYFGGQTIVVNRVNGLPSGPVLFYSTKYQSLEKLENCSYYFPTFSQSSGDIVEFTGRSGKEYPIEIKQYKDGRIRGYNIKFDLSNHMAVNRVSRTGENGQEVIIAQYSAITGPNKEVKDLPIDVQELIKKYDYHNYFQYTINETPTINPSNIINEYEKIEESKLIETEEPKSPNNPNKVLLSKVTGHLSKVYLIGKIDLFNKKNGGTKGNSDVIFLFNYEDGVNDNIKPEVKEKIVQQFKSWISSSIPNTSKDLSSLSEDSLLKVELVFTLNLLGKVEIDAHIKTRINIAQNGNHVLDESFYRSKSFFLGNEPNAVIESAIANSKKKIAKILGAYFKIE